MSSAHRRSSVVSFVPFVAALLGAMAAQVVAPSFACAQDAGASAPPQGAPTVVAPAPSSPAPSTSQPSTPAAAAPSSSSPSPMPPTAAPIASAPASAPAPALVPVTVDGIGKRYTTWDLNIDGAYGRLFTDPSRGAGFGRIRAGVLWIRDPTFLSIGLTYELSNFSNATFGVQGEWLNLEAGVWVQAGALLDVDGKARPGVMGAVGWSIVGVELQGRDVGGSGMVPAFFVKLRAPLSIIAFGLRGR